VVTFNRAVRIVTILGTLNRHLASDISALSKELGMHVADDTMVHCCVGGKRQFLVWSICTIVEDVLALTIFTDVTKGA
jgi:hypothetical protein